MTITFQAMYAICRTLRLRATSRVQRGDHGEGVISVAIAVLIMAFLGVAMWVGFNQIWQNAESTTNDNVTEIGR